MNEVSPIIVQLVALREFPGASKGREHPEGVQPTTRLGETELRFPGKEGSWGFQDRVPKEGGLHRDRTLQIYQVFPLSIHQCTSQYMFGKKQPEAGKKYLKTSDQHTHRPVIVPARIIQAGKPHNITNIGKCAQNGVYVLKNS